MKTIIMYRTAKYAEIEAGRFNPSSIERINMVKFIERYNNGEIKEVGNGSKEENTYSCIIEPDN